MTQVTTPDRDQQRLDADLESRIWLAYYKAIDSRDPKDWSAFSSLVKQRSPDQVSRMERQQGLK